MSPRRALSAAELEAAAWARVVVARTALAKALEAHRVAADRATAEAAARAGEDVRLLRNFRALAPFARRALDPPTIPTLRVPAQRVSPDPPFRPRPMPERRGR